jgi:hypothetical protein
MKYQRSANISSSMYCTGLSSYAIFQQPNLPTELVEEIFEYVWNDRDIQDRNIFRTFVARGCNGHLKDIASKYLFREIDVCGSADLDLLVDLLSTPEKAHLRIIRIILPGYRTSPDCGYAERLRDSFISDFPYGPISFHQSDLQNIEQDLEFLAGKMPSGVKAVKMLFHEKLETSKTVEGLLQLVPASATCLDLSDCRMTMKSFCHLLDGRTSLLGLILVGAAISGGQAHKSLSIQVDHLVGSMVTLSDIHQTVIISDISVAELLVDQMADQEKCLQLCPRIMKRLQMTFLSGISIEHIPSIDLICTILELQVYHYGSEFGWLFGLSPLWIFLEKAATPNVSELGITLVFFNNRFKEADLLSAFEKDTWIPLLSTLSRPKLEKITLKLCIQNRVPWSCDLEHQKYVHTLLEQLVQHWSSLVGDQVLVCGDVLDSSYR